MRARRRDPTQDDSNDQDQRPADRRVRCIASLAGSAVWCLSSGPASAATRCWLRSASADEQVCAAIYGLLQRFDQLFMKLVQFIKRRGINCGQFIQEALGLSGG